MLKQSLTTSALAFLITVITLVAWDSFGLRGIVNSYLVHAPESQEAKPVFNQDQIELITQLIAQSQDMSAQDNISDQVYAAINAQPEKIFIEAFSIFQQEQEKLQQEGKASLIAAAQEALLNNPNDPVMGNPEGDIAIVEFFDYNCGYCKRVTPDLVALLEEDSSLRLVLKEYPVLSASSAYAAKAALAANKQGLYEEMHLALLAHNGSLSEASVDGIAQSLGLEMDQYRQDLNSDEIAAMIKENMTLGQVLGVSGTPSFMIGTEFIPGAVPKEQLKAAIALAREQATN